MSFDTKKIVNDIDGKPILRPVEGGETEPMTMGWAASNALVNVGANGSVPFSVEETMRRYNLHLKIEGATKKIELKAEEVVLIKTACATVYTPLVVGQIANAVDPASSVGS